MNPQPPQTPLAAAGMEMGTELRDRGTGRRLRGPHQVRARLRARRWVSICPRKDTAGEARARQLGAQGELAAGIDPTVETRIPSLTKSTRAGYRVPDEMTDEDLREVNNVQRAALCAPHRT